MPDELVTIGNFWSPVEANIAKNHLEAEGIPAFIADEHVVAMHWGLTAALNGIKLQIRSSDLERAEEILSQLEEAEIDEEALEEASLNADSEEEEPPTPTDTPSPQAVPETPETPPQPPINLREERAYTAAVVAIIGLVLIPLQAWVFWLLARIVFSKLSMRKSALQAALLAAFINLLFILILLKSLIALREYYS
jgi:hypothetical protein